MHRSGYPGAQRFTLATLGLLCLLASHSPRVCGAPAAASPAADPSDDLTRMSLSDLANIDVTSVSKSTEGLQRAPATIYVITHEDIIRSGVTSVPEALRLAPNLLVQQTSSSAYVISARGLAGNPVAQNFSNKLLILIDGRSVYTPLYSGIYANTLDVMLEDVERIEVISGVGATLWGANAMNGVINIITRASYLTQGRFADVGAGNQQQFVDAREGVRLSDDATLRAYAFGFHRGAEEQGSGATAHDGWNKGQVGFRSDWSGDRDSFTVQGDYYHGAQNVLGDSDSLVTGGNLLTRYAHHGDASEVQIQLYDDQTEQFAPGTGPGFVVHTYDLAVQQSILAGSSHHIVWGGGERIYAYGITDSANLLWVPPSRNLSLANVFAQDTLALTARLSLVYGIKLEDDPYSGWTPLPDVRLSFGISDTATLWAAASRAIRSPTPFDEDVREVFDGFTALAATSAFRPEELIGYELGARGQPTASLSLSAAVFYDDYNDLRTVDTPSASTFFPLTFGNVLRGATEGIDAWASWQVSDLWRLSPGLSWVRDRLSFKAYAPTPLGVVQAGDDPSTHVSIDSGLDLPRHLTVDATVRYMGALPQPSLPHYYELDARVGWQATPALGVSINGANLLHARHLELPTGQAGGEEILRTVLAEVRWKF